jgi:hypothetical protein
MSDEDTKIQFRNCEFAFKCDADWDALDETDDQFIRFCNQCQKQVHYCVNDKQLLNAIKANLCVAINPPFEKPVRLMLGSMRVRSNDDE